MKGHLFCMNMLYFLPRFFPIDWCHKHLKNTIDLLLFNGEHFYGFSESDLWKLWKKTFTGPNLEYWSSVGY